MIEYLGGAAPSFERLKVRGLSVSTHKWQKRICFFLFDRVVKLNICYQTLTTSSETQYTATRSKKVSDPWFAQNVCSMVAAHVLGPKPGEVVLDMCAAPGNFFKLSNNST